MEDLLNNKGETDMPNWCTTNYTITAINKGSKEGKAALKDIYESLQAHFSAFPADINKRLEEYNREHKNRSITVWDLWNNNPHWLGNYFLHEGVPMETVIFHFRCRGEIFNLDNNYSEDMIFFDTETAWSPAPMFLKAYYDKYRNILNFEYFSQEPGCLSYEASSKAFADEYIDEWYDITDKAQLEEVSIIKKELKIYSFEKHLIHYEA